MSTPSTSSASKGLRPAPPNEAADEKLTPTDSRPSSCFSAPNAGSSRKRPRSSRSGASKPTSKAAKPASVGTKGVAPVRAKDPTPEAKLPPKETAARPAASPRSLNRLAASTPSCGMSRNGSTSGGWPSAPKPSPYARRSVGSSAKDPTPEANEPNETPARPATRPRSRERSAASIASCGMSRNGSTDSGDAAAGKRSPNAR
mmetsp:Transcript_3377/g.10501  ORF Transcript_3377/g.10501 Transcript_3377/m.10501 type:complete len:202 (+) Transcript_3377:928-1533(+)